jgi:hypothetical protein
LLNALLSITFASSDNNQRLQHHAVAFMSQPMQAAGGTDIWSESGSQ